MTHPAIPIPSAASRADLSRALRVARALERLRFEVGSPLALQYGPEHQATRAGATCVKFTPAQRQLLEQAMTAGESPAQLCREGGILLALLRLEGLAVPVEDGAA